MNQYVKNWSADGLRFVQELRNRPRDPDEERHRIELAGAGAAWLDFVASGKNG